MKKLRRDSNSYQLLKEAKEDYKTLQGNPVKFKEKQNEILSAVMESPVPNWGSIKLLVSKNGE